MISELNSYISQWWLMMSTNDLILVAVTISLVIFWLWYSSIFVSKHSPPLPPGPRHLPIIGYLPFISRNVHTQFTDMARTYGPIFKVMVGSKLHIVVNTPELAKVIIRDQDATFAHRNLTVVTSISSYGGKDLAFANNAIWRKNRKIFVHDCLSNKSLEATSVFRRNEVRKSIKNVYDRMGSAIDVNELLFSTIANVLTSMIWQNSVDNGVADYSHLGAELRNVVQELAEVFGKPNISDFFPSLAWLDLQGVEKETIKVFNKLDALITRIMKDRIKYNSENANNDAGKKDVLQVLLELQEEKKGTSAEVTDIDIKALLSDILIGGGDTTTSLIEWVMTELMKNPNVLEKVQEELTRVVGPSNIVEQSHISELKYLEATVKETFRLHPIVPLLIPRTPPETSTLGGYTIPGGSTIFVNVWLIQRDPKYWDNPLEFNPNRFLPHEGMEKYEFRGNNLKFLPFGAGRRICPGLPLAEKTQMYVLASLLHSFDWTLPKDADIEFSDMFCVTLRKRKPLIVIPTQRLPDSSLYM